ncbi:MAG: hypothetical protein JWL77_643 [Chthonomonadaceae bacterium]|nr:hypothetical protein [Chthonomonadaceae bacterium]
MRVLSLLLLLLLLFGVMQVACRAQAPPGQTEVKQTDPAQVKADLKHILQDPEFRPEKEQEGLLARFSRWLGERWDTFLAWLRKIFHFKMKPPDVNVNGGSNFLAALVVPVVTAILLVPVVWLLALLIRAIVNNWKGRTPPRAKTTTTFDIDDAAADMLEEPDEWLRQAQHFAEQNDYRRAFRAVFLGILLQLDKAGAIEYNRSRTNGDYVRLLRTRGLNGLFEVFRPLVFEFDLRWYGNRATAEEDYRRCRREYDRIRQLLAAPSPSNAALPAPGRA